jgi:tRNA(fMet)-specific endonuclease VapC
MFVLDTDHLIVAQWDSQPEARRLRERMRHYRETDFFLSVVSIHEQLLGAHNAISLAKDT